MLNRLAWGTDLHFDHAGAHARERFLAEVEESGAEALLLSGDLGEADTVAGFLEELEARLARPIYFVLGNHDFYGSSIERVRADVAGTARRARELHWLTAEGPIELSPTVGLVGHDGWSDARNGDWEDSRVKLTDYRLIQDLAGLDRDRLRAKLQALGDEAAAHLGRVLPEAARRFAEVILVTHVPPFPLACLYEGRPADSVWLPHFTCGAVGEVLTRVMAEHPACRLTVLCGHTHCPARFHAAANIDVVTGGAEYGSPRLASLLELE